MSSKHPYAALLIRRGLYDNLHSFAELEQRISDLGDENSKVVGDAFEVFVEGYLATHQKLQAEAVWLVGQVPQGIRQQMNLPNDAKGIDGIFRTRTGVLVPYQVKFRSQRAYLTYTKIAPFLGLTERATDRIVFTNSNELAQDVKNRDAMRTVRGIDFDDLTEDDLRAISAWLRQQPLAIKKPQPREYQIKALAKISETVAKSDRAHVVMAPGTGKTLVALWAAEAVKPKTVLVLLPSLMLLQQTLDEWSRHNNWGNDFTYLCVCSDPTVAVRDEFDPVRLEATDLEFRVDTSPDEVRRFIERDAPGVKVVFSTYQSSPVVSQGVRGLAPFDLTIFDEAHKTTGPQGGVFAHSLKDENIRIRKRLFFTATPRHYDIRHRDKEGDFRIISMDDETIYGPRAYTLTFGSAARQGIICNYRIVISVVDGQEVNEFALKHGITLVEGDLIAARWVANQIAVERAVGKTGAKRAITFHSRVSNAKEFSSDGTHGIRQYLPKFSVFHVNGDQKSSERKQLIRSFRDASEALITNARCLTEGIDVPAVDMVAFIDPRHSRVDIAQATGRAMRKPRGSNKEVGYVVIPLFLERKSGETLEGALERSDFADVANVLNAMQEQDDDLVQIVREIQEAKGRGEIFDPQRLLEKIEVLGPSIELSALQSNICAEIVDAVGVSWDEMFGRLLLFQDIHEHCRVPRDYKDKKLAKWVSHQRNFARCNMLSQERLQRLRDIGFTFEPYDSQWIARFEDLKVFFSSNGHSNVPSRYKDRELARWVVKQRVAFRNGQLEDWKKERLATVNFELERKELDRRNKQYLTYSEAQSLVRRLGLTSLDEYFSWARGTLPKYGGFPENLPRSPQNVYRDNGWENWNEFLGTGNRRDRSEEMWEMMFQKYCEYVAQQGIAAACYVQAKGSKLANWVNTQRQFQREGQLDIRRRQKLDGVGFIWHAQDGAWEQGYESLKDFKAREGHCRVPQTHVEGIFQLGRWVARQRRARLTILDERKRRLDAIGFVWNPLEDTWEKGFAALTTFKAHEGHCRVPQNYIEGTFKLGSWVQGQRANRDTMLPERMQRLDAIGFVWRAK